MDNLTLFNTQSEYEKFISSSNYNTPNISYIESLGSIKYNKSNYIGHYAVDVEGLRNIGWPQEDIDSFNKEIINEDIWGPNNFELYRVPDGLAAETPLKKYSFNIYEHNGGNTKYCPILEESFVSDDFTYYGGFFENWKELIAVPTIDISSSSSLEKGFKGDYKLCFVSELDIKNIINMKNTFDGCTLLRNIRFKNPNKLYYLHKTFAGCSNLKTITGLGLSSVNSASGAFEGCTDLEEIYGCTGLSKDLDLSPCPKISKRTLLELIDGMVVQPEKKYTLTLGKNKDKLTESEIQVIYDKNWMLA